MKLRIVLKLREAEAEPLVAAAPPAEAEVDVDVPAGGVGASVVGRGEPIGDAFGDALWFLVLFKIN